MKYFTVKIKEEIDINNEALLKVEKNTYKIPENIYCPECQNPPIKFYSTRRNEFYLDDPYMTYNPNHKQYKCRSSICRHTLTAKDYVAMVRKGEKNLNDNNSISTNTEQN